MLMGLVSKNGILLIDAAKERIKEGMPINEALKEAGLSKITSNSNDYFSYDIWYDSCSCSYRAGSEMRAPMAQAVIGGLITSTILTLFVVPIVYTILDDLKNKI